jgi:hypothetical protein
VTNRCSPEHRSLLRQTVFESADNLSGKDLELTDFLRLLGLREVLTAGTRNLPVRAGWVGCQR